MTYPTGLDLVSIRNGVLTYVDMVIGMGSGPKSVCGPLWIDPTSGRRASVSRIDERYVDSVEAQLGLVNNKLKEDFRCRIRMVYSQKRGNEPNYDFMDQHDLVKAVTNVLENSLLLK